jgi:hypothetical protein
MCLVAYATLVKLLLQQGNIAEARAEAESGFRLLESLDGNTSTELDLRLALAEARQADGDTLGAHRALSEALHKLHLGAKKLPIGDIRTRYLTRVSTNVRVLQLANEWLGRPQALNG